MTLLSPVRVPRRWRSGSAGPTADLRQVCRRSPAIDDAILVPDQSRRPPVGGSAMLEQGCSRTRSADTARVGHPVLGDDSSSDMGGDRYPGGHDDGDDLAVRASGSGGAAHSPIRASRRRAWMVIAVSGTIAVIGLGPIGLGWAALIVALGGGWFELSAFLGRRYPPNHRIDHDGSQRLIALVPGGSGSGGSANRAAHPTPRAPRWRSRWLHASPRDGRRRPRTTSRWPMSGSPGSPPRVGPLPPPVR